MRALLQSGMQGSNDPCSKATQLSLFQILPGGDGAQSHGDAGSLDDQVSGSPMMVKCGQASGKVGVVALVPEPHHSI